MELANLPNQILVKLLEEAIQLNTDPKVEEKLKQCQFANESLDQYLEKTCSEASSLQKLILHDTISEPWKDVHSKGLTSTVLNPVGMSGKYEGQFLKILAEMSKAERILDIGMYTGYSAVSFCSSSYSKQVVSLELEPYFEKFVRTRIANTPVDQKLRIIVGPAARGLETLKSEGATFDLIFIDADKINYPNYYKFIMDNGLLSPSGTILVDNALLFGTVYPTPSTPGGAAVAALNEMIRNDDRVEQVLVPLRDGVLMVHLK